MAGRQNGGWLVLAYNGTVLSSVNNGDSWQVAGIVPAGQSPAYRTLAFRASDNRFFHGGVGGAIFSSTDGGASWRPHRQGFDASVTMLAQGGGRFVGVGNAGGTPGGIFTSVDGTRWTSNNTGFADNSQPAGTSVIDAAGRLYTMQHLGAGTTAGQRLIYSDDGLTWTVDTNSFPAPFLPQEKNRLLYTGSRLVAANFAGGLFACYDIKLGNGGSPGTGGSDPFTTWVAAQGLPEGRRGATDDPDSDGFPNASEFALGTAPGSGLTADRPTFEVSFLPTGGSSFPTVTFVRRKDLGSTKLTVEGAADAGFAPLRPLVPPPAVDLGNGLERVTYRAESPAGGTAAFFFRILVAGTP